MLSEGAGTSWPLETRRGSSAIFRRLCILLGARLNRSLLHGCSQGIKFGGQPYDLTFRFSNDQRVTRERCTSLLPDSVAARLTNSAFGRLPMSNFYRTPDDLLYNQPSAARIYDYLLGGHHNFAVDLAAAAKLLSIAPDARQIMWANRAFLRRGVTYLAEQGVDQFLDIGSGIPTVGNVHEIAARINPDARIVYVDIDPVAVTHSLAILDGRPNVTAIQADARNTRLVLDHPEVQRLLDFQRPVAVLLVALLHFVTDDPQAYRLVDDLRKTISTGSYVAISHSCPEDTPQDVVEQSGQLYARTANPGKVRSRAEIARFFGGLEMVQPGLVYVPSWHPDGPDDLFLTEPARSCVLGGVGQKA